MGTATAWHKVSTLPIRVFLARPLILPSAVQMEGHSPGLSASLASQPAHCDVPLWVEVGGHELAHHGAALSSQEMAALRAFSKRLATTCAGGSAGPGGQGPRVQAPSAAMWPRVRRCVSLRLVPLISERV